MCNSIRLVNILCNYAASKLKCKKTLLQKFLKNKLLNNKVVNKVEDSPVNIFRKEKQIFSDLHGKMKL